ncbi:ATPase, V1 complex, subunit C [Daedalea quercina L-15889]|uniref:V-type proton ATPase subunit C n=1 Tax=Daedalea quercina L-15889 TaxID=1314783 RepID=A0A165UF91_9APHY|nr:ATPase, V1 complex, subunit C [Daedalea quercina L-15889]
MPSDQSTWLVAVPHDGDADGLHHELAAKLQSASKNAAAALAPLPVPSFKTGTLESLITLSEELPKTDAFFTATVAKTVDTLRNLLNNDPARLRLHVQVNDEPVDDYLLRDWHWNEGRYGVQRPLRDMVDVLNKEMTSIDNVMKAKLNSYNLAKGSLVQMQRKKTGNLSVRSLADVVKKEHFIGDSEYMQTVLVAVPKNLVKDWTAKYERLTSMVVPRSSTSIASDDEFSLFSVVVFRKVYEDFVHKCRENKCVVVVSSPPSPSSSPPADRDRYIVRDFVYSDEALDKQRAELEVADSTEKELWTELLQLSRTNFSEAFQLLVHIKVLRLFIESVLRYGLPASYTGFIIKPEPKATKRTLQALQAQLAYLARRAGPRSRSKNGGGGGGDAAGEFAGEYQALMEQEYFDFVLFEVPWIVL